MALPASVRGPRQQICLTPGWLYGLLNTAYGPFDFDPAPHPRPQGFDGLSPGTPWGKCNFLNPPFESLEPWVNRALEELGTHGATTVLLCQHRPYLPWWQTALAGRPMLVMTRYVKFKGYTSDLPVSLVAVVITNSVFPEPFLRLQVYIRRPLDIMRELMPGRRPLHDHACAAFGGRIVDHTGQVLHQGPVVPVEPGEGPPPDLRKHCGTRTHLNGTVVQVGRAAKSTPRRTTKEPVLPPSPPRCTENDVDGDVGVDAESAGSARTRSRKRARNTTV